MSTQSGITASSELRETWSNAVSGSSDICLFVLGIADEQVVVKSSHDGHAGVALLDKATALVQDDEPAYILIKLQDAKWVFYSYVPDSANVRAKMLYASSRATLLRVLGDDHFALSVFATDKTDLGAEAFKRHEQHAKSSAPLTVREQEMADIKAAESAHADEASQAPRTIVHSRTDGADDQDAPPEQVGGGALGLVWSDDAVSAVKAWSKDKPLTFEIENEKIVLSKHQPGSLSLPADLPSYTLYALNGNHVFIYCCPSNSPVQNRMLYSLSVKAFVHLCQTRFDVPNVKRLETSGPAEVTDEWILSELGSTSDSETKTQGVSTSEDTKKAFAKPRRPGRK